MLNPNLLYAKQHDAYLNQISEQIRNYSAEKRRVDPMVIKQIHAKVVLDRKPEDIQLVINFLYHCPFF